MLIVGADGSPVENATVRINCDGSLVAETRSDSHGIFSAFEIGVFPPTCVIEAFRPGDHRSTTWPIMSACTRHLVAMSPFAPLAKNLLAWPHPDEWRCLEVTANLQLR
jgi:hypothetical protein